MLTDIVDGRLTIGDRVIPLAAPVRTRLAAWLDHRNRRWPGSINPHLLVSRRTAPRLVPVGHRLPLEGHHAAPPGAARGPHPARDPRHRRRRTPHLRPVRPQRRRRHPLPEDRRAPRPDGRRRTDTSNLSRPAKDSRTQRLDRQTQIGAAAKRRR
ncbi:hypothetical protein [Nocardioides convexus]|uniref:hypothetical protein n=1 Tax=Nocardioides convexus TaxID=2712224 RepID=UPI0024181FEF|nr:hypothetical protein [Nocardioides convexus]